MLIISVVFSVLLFSNNLYALRCGYALIQTGDTKGSVISNCGKPDNKSQRKVTTELYRRIFGTHKIKTYGKKTVLIDEWTYNFGPNDFVYVLSFDGDTLITIKHTGRGYLKRN